MENLLEQIFTLTNVAFCLVIVVLVKIQRGLLERIWKGSVDSKWWNEFFMPLGPLGTGALMGALIVEYPYPSSFDTFWARVFFGVFMGMAAGTFVRMALKIWPDNKVLKMLKSKDQKENK